MSLLVNAYDFNDRKVDIADKSVFCPYGYLAQMYIEIIDLSRVDGVADGGIRLVGRTALHCAAARKGAVDLVAHRSARHHREV
ncbi:MAG: hypothetical protein DELT_03197 [Desulfovibrio sp.]